MAHRILERLANHGEDALYERYMSFLQKISWTLSTPQETEMLFGEGFSFANPTVPDVSIDKAKRRTLLERFRQYCKEFQMLEIEFEDAKGKVVHSKLEPYQVIEDGKQLFLLAAEEFGAQKIRIDISKIRSVRQLPSKAKGRLKQQSVVFRLSGRLAKTYRPYPNEEIIPGVQRDQMLVIKAKTDDFQSLLKRLMKYGEFCEVLSPQFARDEMKHRIIAQLQTMGHPTY